MSNTRRSFLHGGAALAAGLAGAGATRAEQQAAQQAAPLPGAVQVPKMKFGGAEISRMVLGVNPFYGFAHYNNNFGTVMKEWYTQDKVCEIMHQCNRYGINAFNYVHLDRAPQDWARFQAEGGKMHLIIQVTAGVEASMLVKTLKPLALQRQGEVVDKAYQTGQMDTVKEWCKQVRDLGVLVGVGTHKPEVIAQVEEEGWDVDFYAGCVYNRTRTAEEWKKVLNGEMLEMAGEDLSAKRSAAHVPRDAADHEAVLRLQDPGRRTHSRPRHRPGVPHGLREHQADRRRLRRHVPAREGRGQGKRRARPPHPYRSLKRQLFS